MAAPSLPTLAWEISTDSVLAPANGDAVIQALAAQIVAESAYWEVDALGTNYLAIKPKAGSNIPKARIMFVSNVATATRRYNDTMTAAYVGIGLLPEGGDGAFAAYDSNTPYGGGQRFSTYGGIFNSASIGRFFFVESEEGFGLFGINPANGDTYGAIAGALIRALDEGGAEADGRIWNVWSGSTTMGTVMWSSVSGKWMAHSASANQSHSWGFVPEAPTTLDDFNRLSAFTMGTTGGKSQVDAGGATGGFPLYYDALTTRNMLGAARQIVVSKQDTGHYQIQVGGITKRIVVSGDDDTLSHAVGFANP